MYAIEECQNGTFSSLSALPDDQQNDEVKRALTYISSRVISLRASLSKKKLQDLDFSIDRSVNAVFHIFQEFSTINL